MLCVLQLLVLNLRKQFNFMTEKGPRATLIIQIIGVSISAGLVIFGGGTLYQRVTANELRLDKIERQGSPEVIRHEALDEEREKATSERIIRLEKALLDFQDIKADIREIKTELKNIQRK